MKKKLVLIPAFLIALTLAACSPKPAGESGSSDEQVSSSRENTQSSSTKTSTSNTPTSTSARPSSSSQKQSSSSQKQSSSSAKSSGSSQSKTSSSQASQDYDKASGNFKFQSNQLNTPQDIHTDNQNKYLNFSKEYYHITASDLTSFGASGYSNQSTPKSVSVKWQYTAPAGKTISGYKFTYGQKADLSDGYTLSYGSGATAASFYNPYLGDNYFKVTANFSDGSSDTSNIEVFKVVTLAPRNLSVGNLPNCRDTGGRTTYAGGKIKQGMIYRTSGNKFDNKTAPDSEAQSVLKNVLKVKTEINVADKADYNISVSGTTVQTSYMDYGKAPYSNMARNSQRIRKVFEIFGNEANYPVYYHCRIGTDRTGVIGICLNGLLGVPFNEVIQDYAFSNFAPIDGQRYPNKFAAADTESASQDSNGDDPAKYIDEILAMPGKNFQEQTYYSLLSIGVPASTLDNIINIMTEGNKATITPYNLATANEMTLGGGATKSTGGSDYKDPATYVEISSGKSVSYKTDFSNGESTIVAFLGCTNKSSTTKLASGIDLKIDGVSQTIIDRNYWRCGFGTTSRTQCTGYMFIKLGKYNLTEGEHTIMISGKSSDVFKVGTISIFGAVSGGSQGGEGQGGGSQGGGEQTHVHSFSYGNDITESGKTTYKIGTCSCGYKAVKWAVNANVAGTPNARPYKFGSNGNSATYTFNYSGSLSGKLVMLVGVDNYSGNNNNKQYGYFYNGNPNLKFEINNVEATITNTDSYETCGVLEGGDTDETKAAMMEVCDAALKNGENTIKATRLASRSATIWDLFVIGQ